jgi:hypothetical protein
MITQLSTYLTKIQSIILFIKPMVVIICCINFSMAINFLPDKKYSRLNYIFRDVISLVVLANLYIDF